MAIILEGPDAAGKTTLGRRLAEILKADLHVTGSAPKSYDSMVQMCRSHASMAMQDNLIIDRVTPISHPIYNRSIKNDKYITSAKRTIIEAPNCVIIFCRPPNEILMDERNHEWKDYDTPEHIEKILDNCHLFIQRYDEDMEEIPHIKYDWTTMTVEKLLNKIKSESDWKAVLKD